MKKLLITGFDPFGGEEINPSWEAVSLLPDIIGEYALTKLRIPVVFGEGAETVIKIAKTLSPDVVLCIGQAGGRNAITPELVAINLRHANIPDNKGNQPLDETIVEGGKTAYFSTLPVRKMAAAIHENGIPSQVSYSAGAYVCNDKECIQNLKKKKLLNRAFSCNVEDAVYDKIMEDFLGKQN